ncbi:hypothetical protein HLB44_34855 [Aquincola sp. S2]|uniref:Terminase small subunit n=1 Tax=Pseudaquabacterium terrae TaxID=2732868 RepID=A0ABX2EU51_9BURK|nr:hypothetical protein [Aquabacterium terrae]NRF72177.1 hypothetical protein [Aquabacterium terrae]
MLQSLAAGTVQERPARPEVNLLDKARQIYQDSRQYHGTSKGNKAYIQEAGIAGASERGTMHAVRSTNRTLTSDKLMAKQIARLGSFGDTPALVRTIGVPLERPEPFFQTTHAVEPGQVLGSKNSEPGTDAQAFQAELARSRVHVPIDVAGQMLRNVQSDSEDDFG